LAGSETIRDFYRKSPDLPALGPILAGMKTPHNVKFLPGGVVFTLR
jgi:hypothetical protein